MNLTADWIPAPGLLPARAGFAGMTMGKIGCESSLRRKPGSRPYPMATLSGRSNDETVPVWFYYYFFFGIGPPIGLQTLEEQAVGGWSAHGFFYGPGECR
jgi:hypothetical protein